MQTMQAHFLHIIQQYQGRTMTEILSHTDYVGYARADATRVLTEMADRGEILRTWNTHGDCLYYAKV